MDDVHLGAVSGAGAGRLSLRLRTDLGKGQRAGRGHVHGHGHVYGHVHGRVHGRGPGRALGAGVLTGKGEKGQTPYGVTTNDDRFVVRVIQYEKLETAYHYAGGCISRSIWKKTTEHRWF